MSTCCSSGEDILFFLLQFIFYLLLQPQSCSSVTQHWTTPPVSIHCSLALQPHHPPPFKFVRVFDCTGVLSCLITP
uniref:Putative ovule protein n=1 Tax=Solanum chacoense TaxID=4108 RepID=A0A0V0GPI7_SOLCH